MAVLALAVPASIFAYRGMFGGYMFTALPTSLKAGSHPNNIVQNSSDETSVTSAGSSEKLQPIDIRGSPKPVPRVIFTIPISSRSGAGAQAPAPTASTLGPAVASSPDPQVAPPPASAPVPIPASPEPKETGATVPPAREQVFVTARFCPVGAYGRVCPAACLGFGAGTGFLGADRDCCGIRGTNAPSWPADDWAASVPPPASAPLPLPASPEPKEAEAIAPATR